MVLLSVFMPGEPAGRAAPDFFYHVKHYGIIIEHFSPPHNRTDIVYEKFNENHIFTGTGRPEKDLQRTFEENFTGF
ncbi:MAG TPA: hypothetical protein DC013_09185 [Ruminococcaceae bacterium]|nr:hypothetical protein [Oscillospiraceae bacterium]